VNAVGFFGSLAGNDTEYLGYQLCRGLGGCVLIPPPISSTARDVSVTSTGSGSSDKSAAVSAGVKAICDDWLVAVPGEKSNGHKITFACAWNPENVRIEAWRCVADQDGRTTLRSCELNDVVDGSLVRWLELLCCSVLRFPVSFVCAGHSGSTSHDRKQK
jgi:hypothetical protein